MNRRDWMVAGAAAATAQMVGAAVAGCRGQEGAQESTAPAVSAGGEGALATWSEAARECLAAGDRCMWHCITLLGQGNTSMQDCAQKCHQMLAICRAVGPIAAMDSPHAGALAALCRDVCSECAAACRPHAGHHPVCRDCMQACERTMAAAAALA